MLETLIVLACIALDQLTKVWAAGPLLQLHGGDLPLWQGVFHLRYVENKGAAFGMLQNQQVFFLLLTAAVVVAVIVLLLRKRRQFDKWIRWGLSLLIAGAAGNFIDRALLGYVRDLFDFRLINFAVFNVADAAITISVICLAIGILLQDKREREAKKALAAEASSAEAPPKAPTEEPAEGPAKAPVEIDAKVAAGEGEEHNV